MSVKVHDGYVWEGPGGMDGLLGVLDRFAAVAAAACLEATARQHAAAACRHLDRGALGRDTGGDLAEELADGRGLLAAIRDHADNRRSGTLAKGRRSPDHDWECTVVVYPLPGHPPLVRLVAEKYEVYTPGFVALHGIRPWPFWDNTDRPGDVTEVEWETRRAAWAMTYTRGSATIPAVEPICVQAVAEGGLLPGVAEIVAAQPTLGERAMARARDAVRDGRIRRLLPEDAPGAARSSESYIHMVTEALWEHDAWTRTEEGRATVAAAAAELEQLLPPAYSVEDLVARPGPPAGNQPGPKRS